MSFNKTTTVTNKTGLGDDQMVELTKNQGAVQKDVKSGFKQTGKDFDTVFDKFKKNKGYIKDAETGINKNTNKGFTNLSDSLSSYGDTLTQGQTDATAGRAKYYNDMLTALKNNTGGLATQASLDTGFSDATGRFDTLDTNVGNVQNTADTISTDVGNVQTTMDTGFADAGARFNTLDTGQTDAAATAEALSGQLTDTQSNVLGGQGDLQGSLDTMSDTSDIYATQSLENQAGLASNQEGFTSSFDDYVERYSEDATLAQQTRADMQQANANANQSLREDIGNYSNATSSGQQALGTALTNSASALGSAVEGGFSDINQANTNINNSLEGGFSDIGYTQNTLGNRMINLKTNLNQTGADLDANTRAQYQALSSAFDENGQLISNSIDAQGNTLTRNMDDQGNMITSKFDASGQQVDRVSTNLNEVLSKAENNTQKFDTLISNQESGFAGVSRDFRDVSRNQEDFNNNYTNTINSINDSMQTGFNNVDAGQVTAARDLAKVASTQNDLDMGMRQNFHQLGNAFDDTGSLIESSIDRQGNTIARSMDDQGNLLLRSFDVTGRAIGDKVVNIYRSLDDLQNMQNVQGANASMGNLSPAMSGQVPVSGFASPFATTR